MKNISRALTLVLLSLGLICYGVPQCLLAEHLNALGQLITKGSVAYIDNSPIPSGTTLLAGDKIRALNAPALISLSNGGRVELAPNTVLSVSGEGHALTLTQSSGKSRFTVPKNVSLVLTTPKGSVKSVSAAQHFSGVLTVEANRVTFSSESGEFAVTDPNSSKATTVNAGESATVPEAEGASSANKGSGTPSSASQTGAKPGGASGSKAAWWASGIGIGAGTTAVAVGAASASGNDTVVSPARP